MLNTEITSWNPNYLSKLPLHAQLAKIVKQKISKGQISAGNSLPIPALGASKLGVAVHIIKEAYEELQSEGFGGICKDGSFLISTKNGLLN